MIKVLIKYERNRFVSLIVKGHAGSGPYGHDLVCAGVSAIVTGGLNNLENPKSFNIKLDEGLAELEAINSISEHDEIVIQTIVCGLNTIAESYGDFIKIQNL
jgi:uncharacterized protein YsxB (DUF464 family)